MPFTRHFIRRNRKHRRHLNWFAIAVIGGVGLHRLRPHHILRLLQSRNLIAHRLQQLRRREPLLQILLETPGQYPLDLLIADTPNAARHQIITHLRIRQVLIRRVPHQHLIQNYTNAPQIALRAVYVIPVTLRTHIGRTTHIVKHLRFLRLVQKLTKTKVSNPRPTPRQKNIGCLNVPVHDLLLLNRQIPLHHLPNNMQTLRLRQTAQTLHVLLQVPVLAELSHYVHVVLRHQDLHRPQHMRMRQRPQSVDLVVEQILLYLSLYFGELKHLDRDGLSIEFVDTLVHVRTKTTTDDLGRVVYVVLYFLHQLLLLLPRLAVRLA